MKNRIIKRIKGNIGLKVLALFIAFLIWMMVTNSNNPIKTMLFNNVPITIVNQDSIADVGKVVETAGSGTVTLKVTERRTVLERLAKNGSDFYVEADMENINDMNTVPLTVTCSNQAVTWDEINILPASLKVTLEDKVELPFVISPSTSGTTASGFEVGKMEVAEGKNIYIAGPESVMQIINQVVAPVNVAGLSADATIQSTLKIIDKNGEELSESKLNTLEIKNSEGVVLNERTVHVAVTMWKQQTDIPIFVETTGTPAFGYRVADISTIPVTISLAGTDEALAALDGKFILNEKVSVAGASDNIKQDIDITSMLADMPNIKLITDGDPNISVEVQIEKTGDVTVSVPISSIVMTNKPEGMDLVFTPADKISIGVHSENGDAADIAAEEIIASVDLSACQEEGNHELPVTIGLPDGYTLVADVTIIVNAKKEAAAETETE